MLERILVAVDGSKYSDSAFDIATELAKRYGSELLVLHVFPGSTGAGMLVSGVDEDLLKAEGQSILDSYEKKMQKMDFKDATLLLSKGDAAQRIVETAKAERCGIIILGSRGKGGFAELLLGSVSHKVTNHSECPVLIVR
jgi:nucleotide-binding universal stress UspA family protein